MSQEAYKYILFSGNRTNGKIVSIAICNGVQLDLTSSKSSSKKRTVLVITVLWLDIHATIFCNCKRNWQYTFQSDIIYDLITTKLSLREVM